MPCTVCLIPPDFLSRPPSVADGSLSYEEELDQRVFGCGWIQQASILLGVPATTMASGQVIFHRFYYRRSMSEFDLKLVAGAALYLSCKLVETPRRVKDLVNIYFVLNWLERKERAIAALRRKHSESYSVEGKAEFSPNDGHAEHLETSMKDIALRATRREAEGSEIEIRESHSGHIQSVRLLMEKLAGELSLPDPESQEFCRVRTNLHRVERHILRETGFAVSLCLVHPHKFVLQYVHTLLGEVITGRSWAKKICQKAWGYLNDSMRTTLCCSVQPSVITVGAIYLAASDYGLDLTQDMQWYACFSVTWDEVENVASRIKQLYSVSEAPQYKKLADPPVPPAKVLPASEGLDDP